MKRRVYDFFGKEINLDKEKCCQSTMYNVIVDI